MENEDKILTGKDLNEAKDIVRDEAVAKVLRDAQEQLNKKTWEKDVRTAEDKRDALKESAEKIKRGSKACKRKGSKRERGKACKRSRNKGCKRKGSERERSKACKRKGSKRERGKACERSRNESREKAGNKRCERNRGRGEVTKERTYQGKIIGLR